MPPVSIRAPARINSGIARSTKESAVRKICWMIIARGYLPLHHSPRKPAIPTENATGTAKISKITNAAKVTVIIG